MAPSKKFLQKSRASWVKRERDYEAKAKHAHGMHRMRDKQLREVAAAAAKSSAVAVYPLKHLIADSWGYHPPVHDGVDLICPASEPLFAICRATVVRAAPAGWWGKGAPSDQALKARGDGIIVIRSLVDAGPIRKGMNLCYGHAEHAKVQVGQVVEAGHLIGNAGFANAWHVHFMVNMRTDTKGVGDRDPAPILNFAAKGG